jgi:hypothetical protein
MRMNGGILSDPREGREEYGHRGHPNPFRHEEESEQAIHPLMRGEEVGGIKNVTASDYLRRHG